MLLGLLQRETGLTGDPVIPAVDTRVKVSNDLVTNKRRVWFKHCRGSFLKVGFSVLVCQDIVEVVSQFVVGIVRIESAIPGS